MFTYDLTEDLYLKKLELRDAPELFILIEQSRDYLREWLPWVDDTRHPDDTRRFIQTAIRQDASNDGFHAGIWYQGKIAGVIGFHRIDWANRSTSIGYWLGQHFQGRGIMTRACKEMVDYALNELDLNRVEIRCAVENRKSRAIPERLGFVEEGCVRQNEYLYDHYVDHVIYGMLKQDWQQQ
ncbi:MAG: GNAT family N-acetyltransferase [Bacillaceae bacterium]|nr:GNAT family N-acetyltransferase [Bacillaceae bacterium]